MKTMRRVESGFRRIIEDEARRHNVSVNYHSRGAQWGRAALEWKRIYVPTPKSFTSFFTGLHELGHIVVGHRGGDGKPEYLWEYEAFAWAKEYCERSGITVPVRIVNNERDIIAEKVREAVENDDVSRIDRKVARFVHEKKNDDPDVKWVSRNVDEDGSMKVSIGPKKSERDS